MSHATMPRHLTWDNIRSGDNITFKNVLHHILPYHLITALTLFLKIGATLINQRFSHHTFYFMIINQHQPSFHLIHLLATHNLHLLLLVLHTNLQVLLTVILPYHLTTVLTLFLKTGAILINQRFSHPTFYFMIINHH